MADDEPVFTSLKDRIAALNLQNGGAAPSPLKKPAPPKPKPKPPVRDPSPVSAVSSASSWKPPTPAPRPASKPSWPPKPTSPQPSHTPSLPSAPKPTPPMPGRRPRFVPDNGGGADGSVPGANHVVPDPAARSPPVSDRGARPPLPARKASTDPVNGLIGRKVPPSVPGARPREHSNADVEDDPPAPSSARARPPLPGARPGLPPRLPARPNTHDEGPRDDPPAPAAKPAIPRRTLPPSVPRAPSPPPAPLPPLVPALESDGDPPPIPMHSRPPPVPVNSRPKAAPALPPPPSAPEPSAPADDGVIAMPPVTCLVCRDYTEPDYVASQYPRDSLPYNHEVRYLADALCAPFEFKTDKARAIFTWCHHNIQYDVANFMNGTIPAQTAEDTIRTGLAVCEGYSQVVHAVAEAAGLEVMRVSGHGKGYGYRAPPGGQVPSYAGNHAWNAIRLDDGGWKLLDACWGAGSLTNGVWETTFKPHEFTMSNSAFGEKHFPEEAWQQLRDDGRELSWEEYILGDCGGDKATAYINCHQEGLDATALEPSARVVDPHAIAQGGLVRFQIPWMCDHWAETVVAKQGGPLLLMVLTDGEQYPMDYNGEWWYIDIPANKIRNNLSIIALETINGKSARGVTKEEYLKKKGRVSASWVGMIGYEVA